MTITRRALLAVGAGLAGTIAGCTSTRSGRSSPARPEFSPDALPHLGADTDPDAPDPVWTRVFPAGAGEVEILAAFAAPTAYRVLLREGQPGGQVLVRRSIDRRGQDRGVEVLGEVTAVLVRRTTGGGYVAWSTVSPQRRVVITRVDRAGAVGWRVSATGLPVTGPKPEVRTLAPRPGGGVVVSVSVDRDREFVAVDGVGQLGWRHPHNVRPSAIVPSDESIYVTGEVYRPQQCPGACVTYTPIVVRISPTSGVVWRHEDRYPGVAVPIGDDGVGLVGHREIDADEVASPPSGRQPQALAVQRLRPGGRSRWLETYPQRRYATLVAHDRLADGSLLLFGTVAVGDNPEGPPRRVVVTRVAPDGSRTWTGRVGPAGVDASVTFAVPTGDGTYLLGGSSTGRRDGAAPGRDRVAWGAELRADGTVGWRTTTAAGYGFESAVATAESYFFAGRAARRDGTDGRAPKSRSDGLLTVRYDRSAPARQ